MLRKLSVATLVGTVLPLLFAVQPARAQSMGGVRQARPVIAQAIDERARLTLEGNTRPEASATNDRGAVADDLPLEHMLLQLRRPPEREQALQKFIQELHTRGSPNFHHWIAAEEFGQRFGLAQQDLDTVTGWLESHGLKVNLVYPSGVLIDFSGTAGQVRDAFQTEIHQLEVRGERHIANMQNPRIPAAIAPAVVGIVSLHDFRPRSMHKVRPDYTFVYLNYIYYTLVPGDLATIYNFNPLFSHGISGQGQTIVLIEDTDVFSTSDLDTFRSTFGLSPGYAGTFTQVHPGNNCSDPGANPNDIEATLDAEWAAAAAPSAAIELASCADTNTTFGGLIAMQNLLNAGGMPPAIVSVSYGECEPFNGAAANAAYSSTYQQGVTAGVSFFVSSGDEGAASCDPNASYAAHGIAASGFASTPYNVAVGGTDFGDSYAGTGSTYWSNSNSPTYESALSYINEIPWDLSCASQLIASYFGYAQTYGSGGFCNNTTSASLITTASGSGAPSSCATGTASTPGVVSGTCAGWPKPAWQQLLGVPQDGVRDIPDVSLFASNGVWAHYYVFCFTDTANGGTSSCTGSPANWSGAGGTSFGAPIWAGIQALVNQKTGARQGNPNPTYYQLAATEYGNGGSSTCNSSLGNRVASSCIFYDVTQGDMDVDCYGSIQCYTPSGTYGVLSTSSNAYSPSFGTGVGWDFATGIGTVNVANLVNGWPASGANPDFSLAVSPSSVTITQGGAGNATVTVSPLNGFSGSVTFSTSALPSGVTAVFSPNPTSTGSSVVTFTATGSATTGSLNVTVTGKSGALSHTTTVSLTVNAAPPPPNYTLSASPASVAVTQGSNAHTTITITPSNGFNGGVTFSTSALPSGVTAAFSPNPATSTATLTFTATGTATTGSVNVTVTGTAAGNLSHATMVSLTVNAAAQANFSLSASPGSVAVTQGTNANATITVTPSNGFNGSVTLSNSALPSGVTAAFSPNPTSSGSSILTFTASSSATTGQVNVTVTGTSGVLMHTTTVTLTVNPAAGGGNYTLSASPSSVTVVQGHNGASTITITPSNGFNGSVMFSASNLPGGVSASFSPNPSTNSTTLTLTVSSSANTGTFNVTVTGTSGNLSHSVNVSLTVNPGPNFSLAASPSQLMVARGANGHSTITVTPTNGFNGSVSLTASRLPSGVTASFSPNPTTTSSTLTLTVSSAATPGTYNVRISGSASGGLSHRITVTLTIQ